MRTPGDITLLILVSLIPGAIWIAYFYRQDVYEPEPKAMVARVFLLGAVMVVPAAAIELPLKGAVSGAARPSWPQLLATSVIGIGFVEEYMKYLAVKVGAYQTPEFDEVMDGIIYGVSAGLGFAALENFFYSRLYGLGVGLTRAFLTFMAHATFSGLVGYNLGLAKMRPGASRRLVARGLVLASVLHGVYDFVLLGRFAWSGLSIVLVLLAFLGLRAAARRAGKLSRWA